MADSDDLELASEDDPMSGNANGRAGRGTHPVRKRINIKLRTAPSSKSRPAANASVTSSGANKRAAKLTKGSNDAATSEKVLPEVSISNELPFDDDDKAIDFPSMKMPGTNDEPFHRNQKLTWNQKVNLLGEKVVDPLIHSCEKCSLPILIYGRMIPCKHVFCFSCAKLTEKSCPRCSQPVQRIEQSALGTVFVCTFGGTKHGVSGCHRTYLSMRDLQSHIAHRHYGAGREPQTQRPTQSTTATPSAVTPQPVTTVSFSMSQQQQQPTTSMTHDANAAAALVYRTIQNPPPQGPPTTGLPHLVMTHPPPSMSQPPPQMTQPPPQYMMTSHGTTHVMSGPLPTGPPGILPPGSHVMQSPHGMPPPSAILVQSMPPPSMVSRGTNLITVQLHEDGDYSGQTSGGSGGRSVQMQSVENAMTHYPPPQQQQQYPPPGAHGGPQYSAAEHHQQLTAVVRPMMAHPPPQMGPGQVQHGPMQAQIGPSGQMMVTYSMPPNQMGPPPSVPSTRLGPPPQIQQSMHSGPPPQSMHGGPLPQQGMMTAGPPPPQGMMQGGPPPQGMPPQTMRSTPPPSQGIRAGAPPPQGYPGPPPHHPDQRPQFIQGQPMSWSTPPPTGPPPPQMQHMGQRPSPGNQSMQYYQ